MAMNPTCSFVCYESSSGRSNTAMSRSLASLGLFTMNSGSRAWRNPYSNERKEIQSTKATRCHSCQHQPVTSQSTCEPLLQEEQISLYANPGLTLRYFVESIRDALPKESPLTIRQTGTFFILGAFLLVQHAEAKSGRVGSDIQSLAIWLERSFLESLFWFGCGVLSSVGLVGGGVQTGALFLFPHVCRVALAWANEQQSASVDGETLSAPSTLSALLWEVAIPGFWSGTGSAVGELVPFVLARAIKGAGGDPFSILSLCKSDDSDKDREAKGSSWTPTLLLAKTRRAMENQLSSNAFFKVFTLAVIPNALFDLAGLICGATEVPFWTFLSAVWTAKALVRTPLQTCGLALAVATISGNGSTETIVGEGSNTASSLSSAFQEFGRRALDQFAQDGSPETIDIPGDDIDQDGFSIAMSVVKVSWTFLTVFLFGFFVVSTIEQIAQHRARTRHSCRHRGIGK